MPGKNYIKVTSILLIIAAVIAVIVYPITGLLIGFASVAEDFSLGWIFIVICLLYTAAAVLQLIAGVKGIKGCNSKEAAEEIIKWGKIILVIAAIAGIVNFFSAITRGESLLTGILSILFAFVFPGIYIYGAMLNKKA